MLSLVALVGKMKAERENEEKSLFDSIGEGLYAMRVEKCFMDAQRALSKHKFQCLQHQFISKILGPAQTFNSVAKTTLDGITCSTT